jgi:septum formation protein
VSLAARQSGRKLVLASASSARADMLRRAGLDTATDPADIDEAAIKHRMQTSGANVEQAAQALADAKARHVSRRHEGALVIGADQMLECDGRWFDKPADLGQAAAQLRALSGRPHRLISSAVVAENGEPVWNGTQSATLHVRPLGETFIASYVAAMGNSILGSVGAYQIEGLGAQLFDAIEGDLFTILGLPLLPLLEFLRRQGVLLS